MLQKHCYVTLVQVVGTGAVIVVLFWQTLNAMLDMQEEGRN